MMRKKKPNIVLITPDSQRHDTISSMGNSKIKTPNLDKLCSEGVVFTRCYSASPECVPARVTIKTGLNPWLSGSTNNAEGISPQIPTIMSVLSKRGYHTQAIGKIHFRPTRELFGFNRMWLAEEIARPESDEYMQELISSGYGYVEEPNGMRSYLYYIPQVSQLPKNMHSTAWIGRKSVEYINEIAKEDKPFFLWIGFVKPHPPFDPPVPYNSLYEPCDMDEPILNENAEENYTIWNYRQNRYKWMESMKNPLFFKLQKAFYYGCITFIDEQIGLIIKTLEINRLKENTIIIFTSDHGEYLGDYYCFGKRGFQDSVARVPFIISYDKNLPQGEVREGLVGHADIMPTVFELCGIDCNREISGESLVSQITNSDTKERKYFFGQYHRKENALYLSMNKEWKFIYDVAGEKEILYNYIKDPKELRNFANDSRYQDVKRKLKGEIINHFREERNTEAIEGDDLRGYENPDYKRWKEFATPLYDLSNKGRLYQFPPSNPNSYKNRINMIYNSVDCDEE